MEKQSQNPMAVEPVPRLMARIGTNALLARLPRRRAVCGGDDPRPVHPFFYFRGICYNRDAVLAGRQPCLTAAQAGALYQKAAPF